MLELQVIGALGQDSSIKEINGQKYIAFSICENQKWVDKQQVKHEKSTWVECLKILNNENSKLTEYLKTGTKVYVSGRAGASAYTNKNGELVASIKVFVEKLELISQKMPSNQQTASQPTNYPMQQGYDQPQAQYTVPQGNIASGFNPPF